jgi:hypothetical protein
MHSGAATSRSVQPCLLRSLKFIWTTYIGGTHGAPPGARGRAGEPVLAYPSLRDLGCRGRAG